MAVEMAALASREAGESKGSGCVERQSVGCATLPVMLLPPARMPCGRGLLFAGGQASFTLLSDSLILTSVRADAPQSSLADGTRCLAWKLQILHCSTDQLVTVRASRGSPSVGRIRKRDHSRHCSVRQTSACSHHDGRKTRRWMLIRCHSFAELMVICVRSRALVLRCDSVHVRHHCPYAVPPPTGQDKLKLMSTRTLSAHCPWSDAHTSTVSPFDALYTILAAPDSRTMLQTTWVPAVRVALAASVRFFVASVVVYVAMRSTHASRSGSLLISDG